MPGKRILLADDHPLVREGLVLAIRVRRPDLLIDCVDTIAEAEVRARAYRHYRLMLLDYRLPDADGFSGLFRMQHILSAVPIALVSAYTDPPLIVAARAIGAAGFLSKTEPLDALASAIDQLLDGGRVFPTDTDQIAQQFEDVHRRLKALSRAQMRVLGMLAKGHLNKQIAGDLNLAEGTVKAHMTAIFRKLGVNNRVQALLAVRPLFDPQQS